MHRIRSKQNGAISELIEKYKDRLYGLCYHLERNNGDIDDLFQDVWLKVIEKLDGYDTRKSFWTWLASITVNTYRDKYRRLKVKFRIFINSEKNEEEKFCTLIENIKVEDPTPEEEFVNNELKGILTECLLKLDDKYRIPVVLQYYRDMTYEDIGETMGIPTGTVKSRLNEAKRRLRIMVEVNYDKG